MGLYAWWRKRAKKLPTGVDPDAVRSYLDRRTDTEVEIARAELASKVIASVPEDERSGFIRNVAAERAGEMGWVIADLHRKLKAKDDECERLKRRIATLERHLADEREHTPTTRRVAIRRK